MRSYRIWSIWLIDEGHITNIAVDERYRGLGVGNKILEGIYTVM